MLQMPEPLHLRSDANPTKKKDDDAPPPPQPNPATRPSSRRVSPSPLGTMAAMAVEKVLPNGDLYTGTFAGNAPHGTGKYLWKDGCMYEGEWRKGKASGWGKFSWPSGATYEGEFRSGRMDGHGTFTGPDGDTYVGSWVADRKHGAGRKSYANGDFYDGAWRRNLPDGHGRYVWRNGNQYVGEWRSGAISGRGILIWADGKRFDGMWENGMPKCDGVFNLNLDLGYLASRKRSSVDGRGSIGGDRSLNFPRICIWESDGEAGDITCDIVDNVEASMFYRDGTSTSDMAELDLGQSGNCYASAVVGAPDVKKPGQAIFKGHKNYELMLSFQLGISYSVGKPSFEMRGLRPGDFDPREKFWTRFPPEGSKITPPHQSADFRWKDYCPMVFRHLRKLFGIDPGDYMVAICGNDALRELSSPGKSGSIFYLTQDDRFMIKTVKKSEVKVLLRMLPSYYQHVYQYENSLVTKFFGVHCVKPVGGQKVRFVVMGNLFCSEYRIHKRFDLKGSSYGRTTVIAEEEIDETTTLKDLDLNYVFRLQKCWYKELLRQIDRDCEFLEAERIMDYSLLVGIHFRDDESADELHSPQLVFTTGKRESPHFDGFQLSEECDVSWILSGGKPLIRLGANMPAHAEEVGRRSYSDNNLHYPSSGGDSTPTGSGGTYDVILYFGIIDILQDYDISKKLEHAYKSLQVDPTSISAVDPKLYSKRFRDFVRKTFLEDK